MSSDFWVAFTSKGPRVYHGAEKPGEEEGSILLFNPDLRAVEGVPLHHWNLVQGEGFQDYAGEPYRVTPMNENQKMIANAKKLSVDEPVSVTAVGRQALYQEKVNGATDDHLKQHGMRLMALEDLSKKYKEALDIDEGLITEMIHHLIRVDKTIHRVVFFTSLGFAFELIAGYFLIKGF